MPSHRHSLSGRNTTSTNVDFGALATKAEVVALANRIKALEAISHQHPQPIPPAASFSFTTRP